MKKVSRIIFMLGAVSTVSLSASADVMRLAEEKQCMSCHAIDRDMSKAPSFVNIAQKYPNTTETTEMLVSKVRNGGVGHWGSAPMPLAGARVDVSDDEANQLVQWILSMRPGNKQE
ncbi:Cytochrome c-552 precursor [compost metagenome]